MPRIKRVDVGGEVQHILQSAQGTPLLVLVPAKKLSLFPLTLCICVQDL